MDATETEELEKIRKKAMDEVTSALQALENKFPGITEGAAALAGSGVGAAASFGALYTLGTTGVSDSSPCAAAMALSGVRHGLPLSTSSSNTLGVMPWASGSRCSR